MSELDDFLDNQLSNLNKKNGFGGEYSFQISLEINNELVLFFGVNDLNENAARILFDQFDEHNYIGTLKTFKLKISLLRFDDEIDYNYLPNAFTV